MSASSLVGSVMTAACSLRVGFEAFLDVTASCSGVNSGSLAVLKGVSIWS